MCRSVYMSKAGNVSRLADKVEALELLPEFPTGAGRGVNATDQAVVVQETTGLQGYVDKPQL